jgi:cyclin-dependent kinase 2
MEQISDFCNGGSFDVCMECSADNGPVARSLAYASKKTKEEGMLTARGEAIAVLSDEDDAQATTAFGMQWQDLQSDLLLHSLRFLPLDAVCMVPQTCRTWRDVLSSDAASLESILRDAMRRRFPDMASMPSANLKIEIREVFQQCLSNERFGQWKTVRKLREGRGGTRKVVIHQLTGDFGVMKLFDGRRERGMGFHDANPRFLDEGIPYHILREVSILKRLGPHAHVVNLKDVFLRPPPAYDSLYLCYDYCEASLREYSRRHMLCAEAVRSLVFQVLSGLEWCHSHRIIHRDLKPQNLFVNPSVGVLKLSDFSSARSISMGRTYTLEITTLWYRAPEVLLGVGSYGGEIDLWAVGTIIPELLTQHSLFPGDSEVDELFRMFQLLGTPSESTWPGVATLPNFNASFPSWRPRQLREAMRQAMLVGADRLDDAGVELVEWCLTYQPSARPTAREALRHPYFSGFDSQQIGSVPLPGGARVEQ